MTERDDAALEDALGALSDWLSLVRRHEEDARARAAEARRVRRDHAAKVVMAVLSAITIAAFVALR